MNKQLADDQTHVVNHDLGQNLHWMHGLEEYLTNTNSPYIDKFFEIDRKSVV